MPTPARILRAEADNLCRPPQRTARQAERHERIVATGRALMASHGRHNITFRNLAIALSITTTTLRLHFPDLDCLLGEILQRHLIALTAALGDIPLAAPNRPARLREAYFAFTRTAFAGLTEPHLLLTRDFHTLPDDIRAPLEQTRDCIADLLAPSFGREALALLDTPYLPLARIESVLAPLHPEPEIVPAPQTRPEKPQPAPLRLAPPAPENPLQPQRVPAYADAVEKPGAWIYNLGITGDARAPPG